MTVQSGFFNSINGDRKYDATWFAQYFASFIGNGVFPNPSTGLQVVEGDNMNIVVKAGKGWINGYYVVNDSDYVLTLDNADGVLKRIDRVVMRLNYSTRQIEIDVKKGEFASNPVAPTLQRDADAYELALADILINNGATAITQANITDTRLNSELCGIVHGVVNQVDTTTIFNQYMDWFNSFTNDTEQEIEDWQQDQYEAFNAWFATIQDILDGDVAGNLANLISQIDNRLTQFLERYDDEIGDVAQLETVNKNVVAAINEVKQIGNNVKSDVVDELLLINPSLPLDNNSSWEDVVDVLGSGEVGVAVKSVQRVAIYSEETTRTININSVDLNKAILKVSYGTAALYSGGQQVRNVFVGAKFVSDNQLQIIRGGAGLGLNITVEVIEFEGVKSIQRGETSWSYNTQISINDVNENKSLVFCSFTSSDVSNTISSSVAGAYLLNSNTLKSNVGTSSFAGTNYWQVIEFR